MAAQSFHIRIGERAHQARVEISSPGATPTVTVDGESFDVAAAPGGALVVRSLEGGAHRCVTLDGLAWPTAAHVPGHGVTLEVQTAQAAALAAALSAGGAGGAAAAKIKSPMPGRVVRILVAEGDAVAKGDAVIIVEAMKMENEMYAAAAGVVARIAIAQGDTVDAGQLLCELELDHPSA